VSDVIFKSVTGGAITRRLDAQILSDELEALRASPVIFQECIAGDDEPVMLLDGELVSCVAIETPSQHGRSSDTSWPLASEFPQLCQEIERLNWFECDACAPKRSARIDDID
jgi:hypothetical protein